MPIQTTIKAEIASYLLKSGYDNELASIVAELNRAAPGPKKSPGPTDRPVNAGALDHVLSFAVRRGASDILMIAGTPLALRIDGKLLLDEENVAGADDPVQLLLPVLTPTQYTELQQRKSVDFCFSRDRIGRFRANIHYQRGTLAASIRLLPARIPTFEALHLPPVLKGLAESRKGLVLITGSTGSGKSSTLAAFIDSVNNNRRDHVITIEDPIEYLHANRKSIIEQIEVGSDAPDFASSVRSILRQSPDVILVGEMRDAETISTVLTAAETGHLVLSTMHTNDASQTISRILDSFPAANQQQIRQQLSLALAAVVAQQLVPAADGSGRYPASEILMCTSAIRSLIRRGDDHQLYSAISTGRSDGMLTMEQSLADMVRMGRITRDTALAHCFRPDELRRYLHE